MKETPASFVDELRKLEPRHILQSIGVFLATVAPGLLVIFHYKPNLVFELDVVKLVLLSTSISLPLLLLNLFPSISLLNQTQRYKKMPPDNQFYFTFFASTFVSFMMLYLSLAVVWFYLLPFKELVLFLTILHVIYWPLAFIVSERLKQKHASAKGPHEASS